MSPFHRLSKSTTHGLAGAAALSMLAAPAFAQSGGTPADGGPGLEEIVVVAQKRTTNIQKEPEAITAVPAQTLDQANVVDPVDLNSLVPSLVITTSEGFNRSVAIRGIGFNVPQNDAAQPSVSYHIDGIYIANPVALDTGFLDVDHIEVLRGPQGTVFGQNSTGGAINVISKLPTVDDYNGWADLSVGSYALVRFRGAINAPLTDEFAVRASIEQDRHDGFAKATQVPGTNGSYDLSNDDSVHARLQLLWKPSDDFSAIIRAEYADADNHESEGKSILDPNTNPWDETSDWPGKFLYRDEILSATLTYNMPWATLKSLSSWQAVDHGGSVNEDGLDLALTSPLHDVEWYFHKSIAITQEVDLSSIPGSDLDWIVGAFLLNVKEKVGYDQYTLSTTDTFDPNLLFAPPLDYVPDTLYFQSNSRLWRQSWSLYGQGTYHITDDLRFTGGVRYTHDANTTRVSDYFNLYGPEVFVQSSANALTGRAEIDYDVTPSNMVYASWSTGFKPGGGNIILDPAVVPLEFKPETITAYEIGTKNSFLDNKLRINAAAFYYQYDNMQFEAEDLIPYQGGADNIPEVNIYGAEGEFSYLLPFNLRLDGSLTVEKGKVSQHFLAFDNVAGNAADALAFSQGYGLFDPQTLALRQAAYRDVYGNSPPDLPEVTAALNITHTLDFADDSQLLSRLEVQYRDHYATAIFGNSDIYTAPSYVLWNLYFDYTLADNSWDTSFEITNLTNKAAVLSRFTNQFGGETTQQYSPPRQFIARVGYRF